MDLPKGLHIFGIDDEADAAEMVNREMAKYNVRVFIDTEFTDFINPEMISLGLVADDPGSEELYLEFWYPRQAASDFVNENIVPLLWHTPDVYVGGNTNGEIRDRIITWLDKIRGPKGVSICFDYGTDWNLFVRAMFNDVPEFVRAKRIGANDFNREVANQYLVDNGLPRHHALYDARSNKFAFNLQNRTKKK